MSRELKKDFKNVIKNVKKAVQAHKIITICIISIIVATIILTPTVINYFQNNNRATKVNGSPANLLEDQLKYIVLDEVSVESGSELPSAVAYFDAEATVNINSEIKYYFNDKEVSIDELSYLKDNIRYSKGTNKYKVVIDNNGKYTSTLNIVDNTRPIISLKDITITSGKKYEARSFVSQYSDNSNSSSYTVYFKDEKQGNITKVGEHDLTIVVCDESNNCAEDVANLKITSNTETAPTEKKVVNTITQEVKTNTEALNYGVKKVWYVNVTYDIYNDGTKTEVSRGTKYSKIDRSEFNGTTSIIRSEASQVSLNIASSREVIIKKTNEYRAEKGLKALTEDKNLTVMANIRAIEIAYSGVLDHTRPNSSDFSTIWDEYEGRNSKYVGENLAADFNSDLGVCESWRNSPSHYDNIMKSRFTKIGIGRYTFDGKTYWVQLFEE